MIRNMGQPMIGTIEPCNIKRITQRMIEFQQLYRELALIHKQIEFYQTLEEVSQQKSDALLDDTWHKYFTDSPSVVSELLLTDNVINHEHQRINFF